MIYVQQNGSLGKSIAYPSSAHKDATIATSGCGVCSSLMVLMNSTTYTKTLKKWTSELIKANCRAAEGTNMEKVCQYLKSKYGFSYKITSNVNDLKSHIKKGYKAIANVGGKGYFSSSGHFVCVAGIDSEGKAIVLDPYIYSNKFTTTCKGIKRKNYFTYNSSTNEVKCSFTTILNDSKGAKFYLFTPTKKIKLQYSKNDVKNKKTTTNNTTTKNTTTKKAEYPTATTWKNGSTRENVFADNSYKTKIGYINANSSAKCYGKIGGYIVVYALSGSKKHKVGFVKYEGGSKATNSSGKTWTNGKTEEIVYADTAKKSKIGSINAKEQCTCLAKIDNMYLVTYKIDGTNSHKVGFVKYSGGLE